MPRLPPKKHLFNIVSLMSSDALMMLVVGG